MSRKTKRNQQDPGSLPPQPENTARTAGTRRRNLFGAAVVTLLLGFAAAAWLYNRAQQEAAQLTAARNQPALASTHSPSFGPADARVHIVEFADPACETCASFFPHVKKLMADNPGRIRLSVRHVAFHQGSDQVIRVLEAARAQEKYLPVLEAYYATQDRWVVQHVVRAERIGLSLEGLGLDLERLRKDMAAPEIERRMAQDMADARTLGVTQTPEFFVNGRPMPRFGLEELQQLVREELRRAYP